MSTVLKQRMHKKCFQISGIWIRDLAVSIEFRLHSSYQLLLLCNHKYAKKARRLIHCSFVWSLISVFSHSYKVLSGKSHSINKLRMRIHHHHIFWLQTFVSYLPKFCERHTTNLPLKGMTKPSKTIKISTFSAYINYSFSA